MLLSLVYHLLRCLFGLLTVLVRPDLSKDAGCYAVSSAAACGGIVPTGSGSRRSPGW